MQGRAVTAPIHAHDGRMRAIRIARLNRPLDPRAHLILVSLPPAPDTGLFRHVASPTTPVTLFLASLYKRFWPQTSCGTHLPLKPLHSEWSYGLPLRPLVVLICVDQKSDEGHGIVGLVGDVAHDEYLRLEVCLYSWTALLRLY